MKHQSLKLFDKIVMALLGLFPFFSGCDEPREMYGTPTADYLVKGWVTDEATDAPIKNIQVSLKENELDMYNDTAKTDSEGKYTISFRSFPQATITFEIKAEDVDGTANGGLYTTKQTTAEVVESSWDRSKAGSWYSGKATVLKDIKLSK
jgi:putative lipoprotein (rSAM/lipoprotein system)